MPNQWMDEIVKLYDQYYNEKINQVQLVNKVGQIMAQYSIEFKLYDESITKDMEDYQNREPVND